MQEEEDKKQLEEITRNIHILKINNMCEEHEHEHKEHENNNKKNPNPI